MAETKPRATDSLRKPGPKKKLGLSVPPALRLPHEDLIHASDAPPTEQTMPSLSSQPSLTRHSENKAEPTPVAPIRDFAKVANSIVREALPSGIFTGKSKQLYDCLYSLTRGAIVPSRAIRISRPKLMKRARIGARVTFESNVERLTAAGLIQVRQITGEHEGNEYTVFLPEEISMPSLSSMPSLTSHAQNLDILVGLDSSLTRHTSSSINSTTSAEAKTSFKTDTKNDDEAQALSDLNSILIEAARKLTGRTPRATEREQWAELARTLVEELNGAAARAESVSSVPAFLNAHLRRKFAQKPPARKGEGKHSISAIEPSASPSEPHRKLSPEDIAAFTATVADLLGEGKTLEEIETQFAESMHPEDWAAVKGMAQAQMAAKEED